MTSRVYIIMPRHYDTVFSLLLKSRVWLRLATDSQPSIPKASTLARKPPSPVKFVRGLAISTVGKHNRLTVTLYQKEIWLFLLLLSFKTSYYQCILIPVIICFHIARDIISRTFQHPRMRQASSTGDVTILQVNRHLLPATTC